MNIRRAELFGALLGDGCLSIVNSPKRKRKIALFTGHLHNDFSYYSTRLRSILDHEFQTKGYLQKRPKRTGINIVLGSRVFDFFEREGFPIGKKRCLRMPPSILENPDFAIACIRGLFDTDGSIYRRYSKLYAGHKRLYEHLVIQFKLEGKELLEQVQSILRQFGITTNRLISESNTHVLRITRQKDIDAFISIVKPANKYHIERYLNRCREFFPIKGR